MCESQSSNFCCCRHFININRYIKSTTHQQSSPLIYPLPLPHPKNTILLSHRNSCCNSVHWRAHNVTRFACERVFIRTTAGKGLPGGKGVLMAGAGGVRNGKVSLTYVCSRATNLNQFVPLSHADIPTSTFQCELFHERKSPRPHPPRPQRVGEDCFTPIFQLMEPDIWSQTMI